MVRPDAMVMVGCRYVDVCELFTQPIFFVTEPLLLSPAGRDHGVEDGRHDEVVFDVVRLVLQTKPVRSEVSRGRRPNETWAVRGGGRRQRSETVRDEDVQGR